MTKRILILFATIFLTCYSSVSSVNNLAEDQPKVYVVMSNNAYAYHKSRSCKAVKKATHKVKEVTLNEAKKMGRKPCGMCYKNR